MVTKRRDFVLGTCGIAALGKLQAAASLRRVNLGNHGLEFICHLGVGSQPQVSELRNRATGFNWCGPGKGSPAGADDRKVAAWNQAAPNEIRIDYDARSNLSSSQLYRLSADLPVIACAGEFRNASSQAIPNLTEFGCIQIPLRGDLGPLQVHCVSRDSYMVQRVPVGDALVLEGGGWNSPKYCGLLILECHGFQGISVHRDSMGAWLALPVEEDWRSLAVGDYASRFRSHDVSLANLSQRLSIPRSECRRCR